MVVGCRSDEPVGIAAVVDAAVIGSVTVVGAVVGSRVVLSLCGGGVVGGILKMKCELMLPGD